MSSPVSQPALIASSRGVVVDQYFDYFNSANISGPPQNYLVARGEVVLGQLFARPNGVAGAIITIYDGVDATGTVVYTSNPLGTGDGVFALSMARMKTGLFIQSTAQQLKFLLCTFRQ